MAAPANGRLDREGHLSLMKKYGVAFEGPIAPEYWPREYAGFFNVIRQISLIRQLEYFESFNQGDLTLAKLRRGSVELVNAAREALERDANEQQWRRATEERVFEPFNPSVRCSLCGRYKLKPYVEAMPVNTEAEERLRRELPRREMCKCSELQLGNITVKTKLQPEFSREIERRIIHEDVEELEKAGLKKQKPDTVIGLGPTPSFENYTSRMRRRHSPFEPGFVLYPFIVVEAKSEKAPDSWGSVERQSAFAVRTCLQLQKNLRRETEVDELQCLVWFFAFKGEEWRLYAAVPDQMDTRVIDLWHGTILSEDGALQLILIIDYLRSWAYNVYRTSVLRCLNGGRLNPHRLTPGVSVLSQMNESELELLHARSAQATVSRNAIVQKSRHRSQNSTSCVEMREVPKEDQQDPFNWTRWIEKSDSDPEWAKTMTVRHTNLVILDYISLKLPENAEELRSCLQSFFPEVSVGSVANQLLEMFVDNELAIETTDVVVSSSTTDQPELVTPVRALIFCRSAIRKQDWQISRQILCITCSLESLILLMDFSGEQSLALPGFPRDCHTSECECLNTATKVLSLISGSTSASLALGRICLRLRRVERSGQPGHLQWEPIKSKSRGQRLQKLCVTVLNTSDAVRQRPFMKKMRRHWIIEAGAKTATATAIFSALVFPELVDPPEGIIVKKPNTWPGATHRFCLLVMNDKVDFKDTPELGKLVQRARDKIFGENGERDPDDDVALDRWVQALRDDVIEHAPEIIYDT